ncbi:MAG: amino acid synthesis family protein [Proteobacteria bacterium]|nr:amino acid synthesis family protein [Pseudomonadota bacterium]MDA1324567.1 amino acid synthesis family protein [Pseudomonadota bacterium]
MDDARSISDIQTPAAGDFGALVKVRKFVIHMEEILHEFGPPADPPQLKGYIAAVTANPYAGRYVEDLMPLMEALKPLGSVMAQRLIDALGGAHKIVAYGKSAIVGENGELEHAALWHEAGGYGMRELIKPSKAIVPSTKKVAGPGRTVDVPLAHVNAGYVRSHFDCIECSIPDAPRANEIVWIQSMATGPRIYDRAGGLKDSDVKGEDGLR